MATHPMVDARAVDDTDDENTVVRLIEFVIDDVTAERPPPNSLVQDRSSS